MPLYRTFGCPRDGCVRELHEHGRIVHMDESWTPLTDKNDTNTTTTGSESAA